MISKKFYRKLIELKGWTPFIKHHELTFGKNPKGYAVWSFQGHETFECRFKQGEKL